MGIKASPTCVLSYGEQGEGAVGYLIGEENAGMRYMFTMMNNARLSVGLEGLSLAERAYQMAVDYAKERKQGRAPGAPAGGAEPDRRPPRRAPHAAHDARVDRQPSAGSSTPTRRPSTAPRTIPTRPPGPPARSWPSCSRPCRRGGAPTSASSSPAWPSRCSAAWATSRRPASPSTTATPASPRSTRAPTASRRWTSSAASSPCGPAARSPTTSAYIDATIAELDAAGDDLASIRAALADGARGAAHGHRLAARQRA